MLIFTVLTFTESFSQLKHVDLLIKINSIAHSVFDTCTGKCMIIIQNMFAKQYISTPSSFAIANHIGEHKDSGLPTVTYLLKHSVYHF